MATKKTIKKLGQMPRVVYVIKAFDGRQWKLFIPQIGVFLTEKEAKRYCRENSRGGLVHSYQAVAVGRMDTNG